MYLSTARLAPVARTDGPVRRLLSGNVLALGLVSLVTDVSAEMVTAILPAYLVLGLHLTTVQYGMIDGLHAGMTALFRLGGGYAADRWRLRKAVAGFGYGLSALAKLGLLAAGPSVAGIGGALAADRVGKGLRTPPRDALITMSVPEPMLGRAFGVHRTMDGVGAFLGPLAALGVLALAGSGQAFPAVFVASFCAAALGVLLLVLFVRDRREPAVRVEPRAWSPPWRLLATAEFRRVWLAAVLLGLVTIGDGFVYLLLQRREDLSIMWFPLLAVGTNLAYLLLATPLGWLADRIGRGTTVAAGCAALLGVYVLLATGGGSIPLILLLYGAFYAATDGVLMACTGPVVPERWRTSGMAVVQTGQALAYLVSSLAFGAAWQVWGPAAACWAAAAGAALALPLCGRWLR
ncbi:MFS family permease [Streptosporangium becharense]|uniref:MFS family permease n=1 Tax=Streptosporangium becharense TaxID=1816182 RepID=A0A7W9MIF0_9ACTN|nr:MFS transporter [Streptosporangium becharense]MBB2911411.1 MFS family permease [Streptosporangium becharense]MBB5821531.1 MFS family permease [Streptosporangium becharense]